ncbi:MAG: N-6 DNA methylase [Candidatus Bathyarchaeota archaeon]|nr:N-6 DNA methylase [Candidatus Bathyarchaeota archaeon]
MLEQFLEESGLNDAVDKVDESRYRYKYVYGTIDFVSLSDNPKQFYQTHIDTWCENKTIFFVAAIGESQLHICDSQIKPSAVDPVSNATICSFDYGEQSPNTQRFKDWFKKRNIDSGLCLKEIQSLIESRKRAHISVNKDLLKNLRLRRQKIIVLLQGIPDKEQIAQKLLDRCLFIRFIEDRADRKALKDILSKPNRQVKQLIDLFDFYNTHLNGDLFEKGDIPSDINPIILFELSRIFGSSYVLSSDESLLQTTLAPYNFNKIPVALISNIYEAFLTQGKRRSQGIVFTPENLVDYVVDKVLDGPSRNELLQSETLKVLDPACGSGVFLVKLFERIVDDRNLSVEEKADIVRKHLYGIDTNPDALRIAALSLYLKILENEEPIEINRKLFSNTEPHFMFPGLRGINLHKGDALFGDILKGSKFDIILGNPPWGYEFSEKQKAIIETRWSDVSKYQSSQIFLLVISKWMKDTTKCGVIVNLSNFTNGDSVKFRKRLESEYSLKTFVSLSRVKPIIFGYGTEPSCVIIFDKVPRKILDFIIPDLTLLSKQTRKIMDNNKSSVELSVLRQRDDLWHIYAMGYNFYEDLLNLIEVNEKRLNNYKKNPKVTEGFEQGLIEWSARKGLQLGITREQFNKKFKAAKKIGQEYLPYFHSVAETKPYFGAVPRTFLVHGDHLERPRDLELFQGSKLVVTRMWPIKAFVVKETMLFNTNFNIFKISEDYPTEFLLLFEAILNSSLANFYIDAKFIQRKEASFSKVNKEDLGDFPIPDLDDKHEIVEQIIDNTRLLHKTKTTSMNLSNRIDQLILELYDLDYYNLQQLMHYKRTENCQPPTITAEDMSVYCKEFSRTFSPFLKEGLAVESAFYIFDYHSIVEFEIGADRTQKLPTYKIQLRDLILSIEVNDIETNSMEETKKTFYEGEKLYIFKPNSLRYWTELVAINDANEEISLFFKKMRA